MLRTAGAFVATIVVLAVASSTAFAHRSAVPTLKGTVGPGYTISLKRNGIKVKTLKAGKYLFVISDKAKVHNSTLQRGTGGGKALTTVRFVGTKSVLITLTKGRWKYYCTPHEAIMFGYFTVN
jgi:plastocyanin